MKLAVTDTNVFIDLFRADLLAPLLLSGMAVHTTNEAINELGDKHQVILRSFVEQKKISVTHFSPTDIGKISQLPLSSGLSFVDRGIYYCARNLGNCLLLSNNTILHSACKNFQIETSNTVQLLRMLKQNNVFSNGIVCKALSLIRSPSGNNQHFIQDRKDLSQLCGCEIGR